MYCIQQVLSSLLLVNKAANRTSPQALTHQCVALKLNGVDSTQSHAKWCSLTMLLSTKPDYRRVIPLTTAATPTIEEVKHTGGGPHPREAMAAVSRFEVPPHVLRNFRCST
eukprot:TRINITY_DN62049_c0_g1_i1.p1 TRINITY_DN62049_c0_g1~~TRINITY_DN62049_c0_g1_i1.p1  ORF type:complete len:111 (+),score=8.72 TRINITY_DN62049_c0_g1_i1:40-372(+)